MYLHRFMRAIGFSEFKDRQAMQKLLTTCIQTAEKRYYTLNEHEVLLGEFCKNVADGIGIAVRGEFDGEDKFVYEYYFPYLAGTGISSTEDVTVERHAEKESYAGVCDDIKVGITLIFYLQNVISYVRAQYTGALPMRGTTLTLAGLAQSGTVMMPIQKDEFQRKRIQNDSANRTRLIAAARKGDEKAIETLTMEDIDMYTTISKKIHKDDVYSLVDTYFMPYGVECDQYSVLGEIVGLKETENIFTEEKLYILTVCCNELTFDICINKLDLLGEPQIGRRFKGIIWLQGKINFPEE